MFFSQRCNAKFCYYRTNCAISPSLSCCESPAYLVAKQSDVIIKYFDFFKEEKELEGLLLLADAIKMTTYKLSNVFKLLGIFPVKKKILESLSLDHAAGNIQ